jgi:hypothetical protein
MNLRNLLSLCAVVRNSTTRGLLLLPLVLLSCQGSREEAPNSGATHWLRCAEAEDCAEHPGAICADDGYCELNGQRISDDATSTSEGDDSSEDASANDSASDATPSEDSLPTAAPSEETSSSEEPASTQPATPSTPPSASPTTTGGSGSLNAGGSGGLENGGASSGGAGSGATTADGGAAGGTTSAAGSSSLPVDAGLCEFASCHPEWCDEVGEPCCDPFPGDGVNYCNEGLRCGASGCELPVDQEQCGSTLCEAGTVCCDRCAGSCVSALSGANCPEDNRPVDFSCDINQRSFQCGDAACDFVGTSYCEDFTAGPGIRQLTCRPLPAECVGAPSCACVLGSEDFAGYGDFPPTCSIGPEGEVIIVPPPVP